MKSQLIRLTSDWLGKEGPFCLAVKNHNDVIVGSLRYAPKGLRCRTISFFRYGGFIFKQCSSMSGGYGYYKLSPDRKTLYFVTDSIVVDDGGQEYFDTNTSVIQQHHIRLSEPDVVVKIGSGESMKEFLCHSAILAYASTKLDSLISKTPDELILSHFNPEGWDLFYKQINPCNNGDCLKPLHNKKFDRIRHDIKFLLPFFQAFDMTDHLTCCENIIVNQIEDGVFVEVAFILMLAIQYDMEQTKEEAESWFIFSLENNKLLKVVDDVKPIIEFLVSVCLPVKRNSTQEGFESTSCPLLWRVINSYIQAHLDSLTYLEIGKHECEWFSRLVHCYLKIESMHVVFADDDEESW
eukprot:scaffold33279_cov22-Cyclotella_meneghiniana.AAC.2